MVKQGRKLKSTYGDIGKKLRNPQEQQEEKKETSKTAQRARGQ